MITYPAGGKDGPGVPIEQSSTTSEIQACFEGAVMLAFDNLLCRFLTGKIQDRRFIGLLGEETIYNTRSTSFTHGSVNKA